MSTAVCGKRRFFKKRKVSLTLGKKKEFYTEGERVAFGGGEDCKKEGPLTSNLFWKGEGKTLFSLSPRRGGEGKKRENDLLLKKRRIVLYEGPTLTQLGHCVDSGGRMFSLLRGGGKKEEGKRDPLFYRGKREGFPLKVERKGEPPTMEGRKRGGESLFWVHRGSRTSGVARAEKKEEGGGLS